MSFTVEDSIFINRPRQVVWDYVIEHDEWRRPTLLEVRKLTDGPPGVGTRYEDRVEQMGRELTLVNEVRRFEPPEYLSWTQVTKEGPVRTVEGSYRLEALDGQTRFILTTEYEAAGLWRLAAWKWTSAVFGSPT